MEIRQVGADERATVSVPVQAYAFDASPPSPDMPGPAAQRTPYYDADVTYVAEEDGAAVAVATAIPMRQNVRGQVFPMAGVAGVATLPQARRRGYARDLLWALLGRALADGHVLSTLYPFRPSFYARFGYTQLPQTRTVRFPPSSAAELLKADLRGTVRWGPAADHYDAYQELTGRLLASQHGFAVMPETRAARLRDNTHWWVATAWVDEVAVGAVMYQVEGYGGDIVAGDMLSATPLARALLLRFFATHTDQVAQVRVTVPATELPELWATDFTAVTEAKTAMPTAAAPMARILSVPGLAGMTAGSACVVVEVTDDPFIAGRYVLDGSAGVLEVAPTTAQPAAVLTAAGLSALVYGVLDPDELTLRGMGHMDGRTAGAMRTLFPRVLPYIHARF